MRDYEVLRRELPNDNEVAESLFHAQVALKKSRGEVVHNMKFGGEVESVSGLEQFRAAISSSGKFFQQHTFIVGVVYIMFQLLNLENAGASVVHFSLGTNLQCKQISPFVDALCSRYPSINFLQASNLYLDCSNSMHLCDETARLVSSLHVCSHKNVTIAFVYNYRWILKRALPLHMQRM